MDPRRQIAPRPKIRINHPSLSELIRFYEQEMSVWGDVILDHSAIYPPLFAIEEEYVFNLKPQHLGGSNISPEQYSVISDFLTRYWERFTGIVGEKGPRILETPQIISSLTRENGYIDKKIKDLRSLKNNISPKERKRIKLSLKILSVCQQGMRAFIDGCTQIDYSNNPDYARILNIVKNEFEDDWIKATKNILKTFSRATQLNRSNISLEEAIDGVTFYLNFQRYRPQHSKTPRTSDIAAFLTYASQNPRVWGTLYECTEKEDIELMAHVGFRQRWDNVTVITGDHYLLDRINQLKQKQPDLFKDVGVVYRLVENPLSNLYPRVIALKH